jgi:hypothetical protein
VNAGAYLVYTRYPMKRVAYSAAPPFVCSLLAGLWKVVALDPDDGSGLAETFLRLSQKTNLRVRWCDSREAVLSLDS